MSSDTYDAAAQRTADAARDHAKRKLLDAGAEAWDYQLATDSLGLPDGSCVRVPSAVVTTDPELAAAYAGINA